MVFIIASHRRRNEPRKKGVLKIKAGRIRDTFVWVLEKLKV